MRHFFSDYYIRIYAQTFAVDAFSLTCMAIPCAETKQLAREETKHTFLRGPDFNKLAKARKTSTSPGTLGLKKFGPGKL